MGISSEFFLSLFFDYKLISQGKVKISSVLICFVITVGILFIKIFSSISFFSSNEYS